MGSDECTDCVQHHCGGHIGQQTLTLYECVLCQFLSLPKAVAALVDVVPSDCICKQSHAQCQPVLPALTLGMMVTRGPPAV